MPAVTIAATRAAACLAAALLGSLVAASAHASETFVCDDGRVLTLTPEQVNVLVETDPCIARHFGREIAAPQPVAAPEPQPALEPDAPSAVSLDLPLPERKPAEIAARLRRGLHGEATAPAGERKPVEIADVPSDFRNVHIINGGSGAEPEYFRHAQ